ncbi:helix-turn-helix transcriptional regulator [Caldimonas tepidiphila]|uniref:helix-turn-helix transcriptional regulator n=1 Tax=Caldimonas tepidiphila TaxID=2315841 RepID=UPI000E5BEF96|nr:WYL domain-containing protein [Caldimonas tepidiphila]
MDRTERFYKIEMLIRNRHSVSFQELRDELEVSPATLKRDLQYLRERMSAPIEYDRELNGYRFGSGWHGGDGAAHELPGVWFSEKELHALLTMHQLLAGLDESGILTRHLQPMFDKLTGMLGATEAEARELMKRVKLINTARRRVPSRHFETLGSALMQRQRLQLRYRKRSDRSVSDRVVSPQRLVHYRNTWYLDAWCHGSEGLRRFAIDAIEDAQPLETRARQVSIKQLEAQLDQGYGIFAGGEVKWARLRFSADTAQWVAAEEWHPSQRAQWQDDGRYLLEVPYVEDTELLMDLGRHAGQVEVLAPLELRQRYDERLNAGRALQRKIKD